MLTIMVSLGGLIGTAVLGFQGWIAVRVISLGQRQVKLEERMNSQENICGQRLQWLREMDKKLDRVAEDTAAIRGSLN